MKINSLSYAIAILLCVFAISCQSGNNSADSVQTTQTNTPSPAPSVNTQEKSNSLGVGKFTHVEVGSTVDPAMAKAGETVFQTKCVSCHSTGDTKLIGPGLKGITKIRTPEWIMNMTYNSEEMTKKDPVARALKEEYKLPMMISGGITDEECRQVLEFLRQADTK